MALILSFIFGFLVCGLIMVNEYEKELKKMKLDTAKEIDLAFSIQSDCNKICSGRNYIKLKFLDDKKGE